jgi:hypothetical protein
MRNHDEAFRDAAAIYLKKWLCIPNVRGYDNVSTPMHIDAHQHFWKYFPAEYDWIDDSMGALRRDFLPVRQSSQPRQTLRRHSTCPPSHVLE